VWLSSQLSSLSLRRQAWVGRVLSVSERCPFQVHENCIVAVSCNRDSVVGVPETGQARQDAPVLSMLVYIMMVLTRKVTK
jgi:hypothetical protein